MTSPISSQAPTAPSKRSRSRESRHSLSLSPTLKQQEGCYDASVPAFLRQSKAAISTKFRALELLDSERVQASQDNQDPSSQWFQEASPDVKARNRYANVQAWANSRIHLKVPEGQCDYINASPISLRDPRAGANIRYIATQGPKQTCLHHFWQMVWHETKQVAVIVMLTRTAEGGREKCFQYYPLNHENDDIQINTGNETGNNPDGSVKLLETNSDQASRFTVSKLQLTFGEETKTVWHFLFSGWPDFNVPEDEDRAGLLELIKLSASKNTGPDNPRIIHCSAGVGRSGTFIALEHLLAELEAGSLADVKDDDDLVYNTVKELREQRMMMVQSGAQYEFLYQVLRDELKKVQSAAAQEHEVKHLGKDTDGTGEPSPKMIKLTKGFKGAILGKTPWSRHRSDQESDRNRSMIEPKTTVLLGFGIGVGVVILAWGLKAFFERVS